MPFLLLSLLSSDTASGSKLNTAFSQKHGSGMSEFLHRLLRPPEGASFGSHPLTIVAAAAGFWLLFAAFQYTGWVVPSTEKKLSREEALEWNIRAVSTIHAIVLVMGSWFCFRDSWTYSRTGNIFEYSFYPDFFARIFLGYLIYDLSNLGIFFKTLRDYSGMIHHAIFVLVTAYVLAFSIFKFPFVWLSLGEASTPFVNFRWRLAVLGMKDSNWYLANGVAMAISFFLARVLANGLGLYHLWSLRDLWLQPSVPWGHKLCVALFSLAYLLNLYWFAQIAKGVQRALTRSAKKSQ